jgi:hypothetical protein
MVTLALVVAPLVARAQPGETPAAPPPSAPPSAPPSPPPPAVPADGTPIVPNAPRDIVIVTPGSRSTTTIIVLASVAGAAVVMGGIGVYWNLDAQSAANNVSASMPTGLPWTAADQQEYERAHDSSVKAGVFYGIGGGLLIGAVVGLILTVPPSTKSVIHPSMARVVPTLSPAHGGGVFGGAWSF